MNKNYEAPTMELIEIEIENAILGASAVDINNINNINEGSGFGDFDRIFE